MLNFFTELCPFFEVISLHIMMLLVIKEKPCNQYKVLHLNLAPSEGIEPPAEEPESSVLSITPRGLYELILS